MPAGRHAELSRRAGGGQHLRPRLVAPPPPSPADFLFTEELLTGRGNIQMKEARGMWGRRRWGDPAGKGVF